MVSTTCSYGVRAVLYLAATRSSERYTPIRRISSALNISHSFLTKVLQQLKKAGLVTSQRGPHGGVALAREPEKVSFKDVVVALDGETPFTECVLGLPGCGETVPCPLHDAWEGNAWENAAWGDIREYIDTLFRTTSVADAAADPDVILALSDDSCD